METLAAETGGRAIVQKNDISAALGQVIRDSRAYYLIAYESPHPDDGKFHKVTVRVKRPRATVFARTGYWAFKRGENTIAASPSLAAVSPEVQAAVDRLADSLRPDADEPAEGRRRVIMPKPVDQTPPPLDDRRRPWASGGGAGHAARIPPHRHAGGPSLGGAGDRFRTSARPPRPAADRFAADAGHRDAGVAPRARQSRSW